MYEQPNGAEDDDDDERASKRVGATDESSAINSPSHGSIRGDVRGKLADEDRKIPKISSSDQKAFPDIDSISSGGTDITSNRTNASASSSTEYTPKTKDATEPGHITDIGGHVAPKDTSTHPKSLQTYKSHIHFLAGGLGGMMGAVCTSPLDVVKTRFQSDLFTDYSRANTNTGGSGSNNSINNNSKLNKDNNNNTSSKGRLNTGGVPLNQPSAVSTGFYRSPPTAASAQLNLRPQYGQAAVASVQSARKSIISTATRHFNETVAMMVAIYKREGPRALFRGLGPNLVGVIPARSINFYVYGNLKPFLANRFYNGSDGSAVHIVSATAAGIATSTATNPIWMIKTRLQLDKQSGSIQRRYKNSLDCLVKTVRGEGVRALYRGLSASYLGVSESVLHWVIYEKLKMQLSTRQTRQKIAGRPTTMSDSVLDACGLMTAAGTAKFIAAGITYPHEVVRTRLRQDGGKSKYGTLVNCCRVIFKQERLVGFYGGLTAHLLRVVPNAAIMFGTYELTLRLFG